MKKKILIVDDEFTIYEMIRSYLSPRGFDILWAKDGQEGYDLFAANQPDLILSDTVMPRLNGPEMVKKIRSRKTNSEVPIILMTSIVKSFKLKSQIREKTGADSYVQKPLDMAALLENIHGFFGDSQNTRTPVADQTDAMIAEVTGSLEEKSYGKILHLLYKRGATGKLELVSDRKRITVYFDQGRPVDIRSNYIQENSLTRMLQDTVDLTEQQIDQSHIMMEQKGLMQGEALVDMGAITREELAETLRRQSFEKAIQPFGWATGTYEFFTGPVVQDPDLLLTTPVPILIFLGVQRHYSGERIRLRFEEMEDRKLKTVPKPAYKIDDFGLTQEQQSIFQMARSGHSISQILYAGQLDELQTYHLLYTLLLTGLLKFSDEKAAPITTDRGDEDAEFYYKRGVRNLERDEVGEAVASFERAIALDGTCPKYLAMIALATHKQAPAERKAGLDPNALIQMALDADAKDLHVNYVLGIFCKDAGEDKKAKGFFERALAVDPDHIESRRELKLTDNRLRKGV